MAAVVDAQERNRLLREVMEREGLGPSVWREKDCITLVRSVIRELSGSEPVFDLPEWAEGLDEQATIRHAPREHGTLRQGWLKMLENEPLLRHVVEHPRPVPGRIGLTPVKDIELDGATKPLGGPLIGVVGPDCALWVRMHEGLRRAHPVADLWEVVCRS